MKFGMHALLCQSVGLPTACRGSLLVECWFCDRKVVSLNFSRSGVRIFFSRVNFVCCLLLGVCSTSVLPQLHVKQTNKRVIVPEIQVAGYTYAYAVTQWSQCGLTLPLCRHSVGSYQEISLHTTHQETLGHSCLSSLSLISLFPLGPQEAS